MKVVITKHFPFGKFVAINMFARLYLKDKDKSRLTLMIRYPNRYFKLIQHERSHTKQQNDLLGIFFYVWYVIEWFFKLFTEGKAYRELCFEREARANETNVDNYEVYVHLKNGDKDLIYSTDANYTVAYYNFIASKDNIHKIKYIEFRPLNIKGSLINRKWGSWLKYIFNR